MLQFKDFRLMSDQELIFAENIDIEYGKSVQFIGANASGKTLLLKTIYGDYNQYEGDLLIKAKQALFYKKKKSSILILRETYLFDNESVWKNLTLPFGILKKWQKDKLMDYSEIAGLSNKIDSKVSEISSSEKKKIEIIRAAVQMPYILLIDDYDTYFDNKEQSRLKEIFDHSIKGGTVVAVSTKNRLENFDYSLKIQNGILVKL